MLDTGADINTNDRGFTALHIVCLHGNMELVKVIVSHSKISQAYDFSLRTDDGLLPWQIAMDNHHYEIGRMLCIVNESRPEHPRLRP